ncbi:MAG: archaeosortase/exosortase family protein [Proteobacteria bacterium]|nr:archaeosortase/exosortase family protein [Burkholderiales bacterium]
MPLSTSGIPYLPDGEIGVAAQHATVQRPAWQILLLFLLAFAAMHWGWTLARGTTVERVVVEEATVRPAAALVRWVDPSIAVSARGTSIVAPGGGLDIIRGCEGIDIMLILAAAICAVPLTWRRRMIALAVGLPFVFALNQARIVTLFFAWRADRSLFETLHTLVLPVLLVIAVTAYVFALVELDRAAPRH